MIRPRTTPTCGGFTLLEAVVATVVLASVMVACLQMQAGTLAARTRIDTRTQQQQAAEDLLELAVSGLLVGGVGPDLGDPFERIHWQGERSGVPWNCVRERIELNNPLLISQDSRQRDAGLAEKIAVNRFTVTLGSAKVEQIQARRPSR